MSHSPPTGTRMSCTREFIHTRVSLVCEFAHTYISLACEYLHHPCNGKCVLCIKSFTKILNFKREVGIDIKSKETSS